jgi:site-specific DNA recombinase
METQENLQTGDAVFVYLRDSGGAEQERSVSDQRTAIQEYAHEHGLRIVRVFSDAGYAGSNDNRPALQEMVALLRQPRPPVRLVLVYAFSRLSRSELDSAYYKADLRKRGVDVRSITEPVPEGTFAPLIEAVLSIKDQEFLKDLSRSTKRGLRSSAVSGRTSGARPPVGYRRVELVLSEHRNGKPRTVQTWAIDEAVAPLVREAFRLRAAGASTTEIHAHTQLLGSRTSYWAMFRNPIYIGLVRTGDFSRQDEFLRIVDDATWRAVHNRFQSRSAPYLRGSYLLTGLLVCAVCGRKMTGSSIASPYKDRVYQYRYYRCADEVGRACRRVARMDALDARVLDEVFAYLTDEHIARIAEVLATRDTNGLRLAQIAARIADVESGIAGLVELVAHNRTLAKHANVQIERLQTELAALQAEEAELQGAAPAVSTPAEVVAYLHASRTELLTDALPEKRRVLASLLTSVSLAADGTPTLFYQQRFSAEFD